MSGKLYIVGTPIGNMGDMSPRGIEVLSGVDFIAAEDTRVSLKLLNKFNIKKPLVSCHEHNIKERSEQITERIIAGESCAVVTDAGMPCISDPGEELVRSCAEKGIEVCVIPGACAAIAALAVSGLATAKFCFEGFLNSDGKLRRDRLKELEYEKRTMIFYMPPHKMLEMLKDMEKAFGDRKISISREITKIHEEVIRTTLKKAIERYVGENPRGEYVIVVEGAKDKMPTEELDFDSAVKLVKERIEAGVGASAAAKEVAELSEGKFRKSELYSAAVKK
ncbi:MAG: 16S rRNA (cytidine(1402)-2'-O)-methyltransferase [Oscillospiraceae bacterium]|nr:16S rRNA (cytidine(1402)-2'-O)-methyltransferase [Oscillospiraceae bacterium]